MGENDATEAGIAEVLALAEATPQRLAASTAGIADDRLRQPPAPGEWSALDILNHLRACEEVWMHSVQIMLITLRALSPADWAREGRLDRQTHTVYSHVRRMVHHEESTVTRSPNNSTSSLNKVGWVYSTGL